MGMYKALGGALMWALAAGGATAAAGAELREYAVAYPPRDEPARSSCDSALADVAHAGSTHEIAFDPRRPGPLWISGQNYDRLVAVTPGTGAMRFLDMEPGSGPHGIEYDGAGLLWVSLECKDRLIALAPDGKTVRDWLLPAGTRPHGLGIGRDGSIWYTGKKSGRIGRVDPGKGIVTEFPLADRTATPIYVRAGPDGSMWATELTGNRIARVTPAGKLLEYEIPFRNSRPIAIVPGPDGAMWFSEEAGSRVARIDGDGRIVEFLVPKPEGRPNMLLAGLAFDGSGNLWVQQYVDQNAAGPAGEDYIVRIAAAGLKGGPEGLKPAHFTRFPVRTGNSVMHRIVEGPDKAIWFTEMHSDKVGRLSVK